MEKVTLVVHGDGTDETDAFQAYFDGKANLVYPDGSSFGWGGEFILSKPLIIPFPCGVMVGINNENLRASRTEINAYGCKELK